MHLYFQDVNEAFEELVDAIHTGKIATETQESRVGEVLVVQEPMIITYTQPLQRVLLNPQRDANPFFHLYESLWMLAGRNDVAPLAYYNSQITDIASDDGKTFNGAYGYRWRNGNGPIQHDRREDYSYNSSVDQLKFIINHLKANPTSRRAVLQMWNVEDDLLKIGGPCNCGADCTGPSAEAHDPDCPARLDPSKDVCCNTHAYFVLEMGPCEGCSGAGQTIGVIACDKCKGQAVVPQFLNMTVCNRSNDLLWGMLGANVVHFSFLQEYMAACIGVKVGSYHQVTNNLHCYVKYWDPDKWLEGVGGPRTMHSPRRLSYNRDVDYRTLVPLVENPERFDKECVAFVNHAYGGTNRYALSWCEPFFTRVAQPMAVAFGLHKRRHYTGALNAMGDVQSDDWRIAGRNWIKKRQKNWEAKQEAKADDNRNPYVEQELSRGPSSPGDNEA